MELLDESAWHAPSWCEGWRVRDVLAHLVWGAEATYMSMTRDILRGPLRPDEAVARAAKRLAEVPVPELADRLRAAQGGIRLPGFPVAIGLGDVLVHSADAFRPLGMRVNAPPADAVSVLDAYWQRGRTIFHAAPQRGRRLVATDIEWQRGNGPEVRGKAIDLLMLVANRRQVLSCLEGPGLSGV
jgi:uncharacterized protein (TIGR03083 family)